MKLTTIFPLLLLALLLPLFAGCWVDFGDDDDDVVEGATHVVNLATRHPGPFGRPGRLGSDSAVRLCQRVPTCRAGS